MDLREATSLKAWEDATPTEQANISRAIARRAGEWAEAQSGEAIAAYMSDLARGRGAGLPPEAACALALIAAMLGDKQARAEATSGLMDAIWGRRTAEATELGISGASACISAAVAAEDTKQACNKAAAEKKQWEAGEAERAKAAHGQAIASAEDSTRSRVWQDIEGKWHAGLDKRKQSDQTPSSMAKTQRGSIKADDGETRTVVNPVSKATYKVKSKLTRGYWDVKGLGSYEVPSFSGPAIIKLQSPERWPRGFIQDGRHDASGNLVIKMGGSDYLSSDPVDQILTKEADVDGSHRSAQHTRGQWTAIWFESAQAAYGWLASCMADSQQHLKYRKDLNEFSFKIAECPFIDKATKQPIAGKREMTWYGEVIHG